MIRQLEKKIRAIAWKCEEDNQAVISAFQKAIALNKGFVQLLQTRGKSYEGKINDEKNNLSDVNNRKQKGHFMQTQLNLKCKILNRRRRSNGLKGCKEKGVRKTSSFRAVLSEILELVKISINVGS